MKRNGRIWKNKDKVAIEEWIEVLLKIIIKNNKGE